MSVVFTKIEFTDGFRDMKKPEYKTFGSSGFDLSACIDEDIVIKPMSRKLIPTGIKLEIMDKDYEIQIRPRSGIAYNNGVMVLNTPGTIDNDYRGEIKVLLINLGEEDFVVKRGMRIAQAVLSKVGKCHFVVENVGESERGSGGGR